MKDAGRWERVKQVFQAALDRPLEERSAYLRVECGGDDDLQAEVDSLLDAHQRAGSFAEGQAVPDVGAWADDEPIDHVLQPGDHLGPYQITGWLGAGGMGEVYKAHDTRLDRTVAIKVLPTQLAADPQFRDRFDREARAVAALNHPHICALHDVGHKDGTHFLVMEHLEGDTLAARLGRSQDRRLQVNEALTIAIQITSALDAAHRAGIVHRDLKPGNVMLTKSGAKLLDFGLAKKSAPIAGAGAGVSMSAPATLTARGMILGTVEYMAPEQIEGKEADARTDLFAFGSVLFEMLSGRKAFEGDSRASLMGAILEREPPLVSSLQPLAIPALDRIVRTCLAKDPDERWQSAKDLCNELKWIAAESTKAKDVWQSTPVERFASTQRALRWIAAVAALAAVAAGVWFLRPSAPAGVPIQTTHSQITIPDNGNIAAGFSNTLAVAPDGRKIAMVVEVNQKTGVWVKALEESAARFVPGSDGAQYVIWSPNSKSLAFRVLNKLLRFDMASSAPVVIAPVPPAGPTFGADWGDDGTSAGSILFWGGSGIMRVSGSGGEPVAIGLTDAFQPRMLPRGRFFYTSGQKAAVFGATFDHPAASVEILKEDAAPVYAPRAGEIGKRGDGFLLWIRGTTLLAQAFDPSTMRLAGESMVLANPAGTVAVSSSLLLYDPAPAVSQFAWVDRNGKVLQLVGDPAAFGYTAMSPDGSRVIVTVATNAGIPATRLLMLDTRRGGLKRLVDIGANTSPVWSPDGQTVLFGSSKGLTRMSTSGVGDPDVVHPFTRRINPTDWSRRGFVLFNQVGLGTEPFDPGTGMNIMMLPVTPDGKPAGEAKPYLQKPGAQREARFSPDGGWVAYEETAESGQSEVFIDTFPERRGAIPISTNGGFGARWNPQGGEVFYRSPAGKLMAVSLKMDKNSADPSTPRELFPLPVSTLANLGSQYDVGQDGKRFLIQVPVKKAPLELIANWQALLK